MALADEVAAASGLVMAKAARVPAAIVRGVDRAGAADVDASALIRPADEDLFRESPLQSLHARRTIRSFGEGPVPREALEEAIRAACTAPAPHHTRPWLFTVLTTPAAKRALLAAMAAAWRDDLRRDGTSEDVIERRIAKSDALLGAAPVLIVPWVRFEGSHSYADDERVRGRAGDVPAVGRRGDPEPAAGRCTRRASHRAGSPPPCSAKEETRDALGVDGAWSALGSVACGPMPAGEAARPRPPIDPDAFVDWS